jgi:hypothetical protein
VECGISGPLKENMAHLRTPSATGPDTTLSTRRLLYFSPAWSGGLADYAHEQCQALGRLGVNVTTLSAPGYGKCSEMYAIQRMLWSGNRSNSIAFLRKLSHARCILRNHSALVDTIRHGGFRPVLLGSYAEYLAPVWAGSLRALANQGIVDSFCHVSTRHTDKPQH